MSEVGRDSHEHWIQIGNLAVSPRLFRAWFMGQRPLPSQDERLVFAELPPEEWRQAVERYRLMPPLEEGLDYVVTS